MSDHPVCGIKVGFAEIFLMPQPPLLTRRGLMPTQNLTIVSDSKSAAVGLNPLRKLRHDFFECADIFPEAPAMSKGNGICSLHILDELILVLHDAQEGRREFVHV